MTCSFVFLFYYFLLVGLKVFAVLETKPELCGAQRVLPPWLPPPQPPPPRPSPAAAVFTGE